MATAEEVMALAKEVDKYSVKAFTGIVSRAGISTSAAKILISCFKETTIAECINAISAHMSVFEYQGFDPAVTLRELLTKFEAKKYKGRSSLAKAPDSNYKAGDFNTDMSYLISLFLTRGTNWANIKKKSTAELVHIMDHLAALYSIKVTREKNESSPGPRIITLSRIAASLPHITVGLFLKDIGRTLLPMEKYGMESLERVALAPSLASLLPTQPAGKTEDGEEDDEFVPHHMMVWISFMNDKVLHSKDKKFTPADQLVQFHMAAYKSMSTTPEQRRYYAIAFALCEENGAYQKWVRVCDRKAREHLGKIADFDEHLPIVE